MSDFDPFDLRGQEEEAERRETDARLLQLTEDSDLKWLMANAQGRRIARRWLSKAGVWRLSFSGDAATTAFNEGQRNVGLALLAGILRIAPERLADLMTEDDYERREHADDPE